MRRLILKLFLFLLPLAVTFAFPAWVLEISGELISIEGVVNRFLLPHPALVGLAYSEPTAPIKLKAVQTARPKVVALGTSRVMTFRSDFFQGSFFNAGGGTRVIEDFQKFLDRLAPGAVPQLLIVGLDQKFFNPNWDVPKMDIFLEVTPRFSRILHAWDNVYRDWLIRKFQVSDLTRSHPDGVERVGMSAIVRNYGYRNDGSHQWDYWEAHEDDLQHIAQNTDPYVRGNALSEKAFAELDSFLSQCQRRGIYVAGFLPPFSPAVYHALEKEKAEYTFVFESADRLRSLFKRYGFAFEDFTDPARFRLEDKGFIDGQHASERAQQHLWSAWKERESRLQKF